MSQPHFIERSSAFGLTTVGPGSDLAFVDIDSDGDLDAFVGMDFFLNSGSVSAPAFALQGDNFGLSISLPTLVLLNGTVSLGARASGDIPTFVDIDGDGDLDALVSADFGQTRFLVNTGSATAPAFSAQGDNFGLTGIQNGRAATFVDIDGDGDLDLSDVGVFGHHTFVLNTGSASAPGFGVSNENFGLTDGLASRGTKFVDLDGDGDLDALGSAHAVSVAAQASRSSVTAFNLGSSFFTLVSPFGITEDIGVAPRFAVYLNTGSNTVPAFESTSDNLGFDDLSYLSNPELLDIDGDGDLDAWSNHGTGAAPKLYLNAGSATAPAFVHQTSNFGLTSSGNTSFADIDADGDLDAFVHAYDGVTRFFENTAAPGSGVAPVAGGPVHLHFTDTRFYDHIPATASGQVLVTDADNDILSFRIAGGTTPGGTGYSLLATPWGELVLNTSTGAFYFIIYNGIIEASAADIHLAIPISISDGTHTISQSFVLDITHQDDSETGGADHLLGTPGNDDFRAWGGDDVLEGLGGDDLLDGDDGLDTASYARAGAGVKVSLALGAEQDTGGAGHDTLRSIERLVGSAFDDKLTGNAYSNQLSGGPGNDVLNGGGGADKLIGGSGNDTYYIENRGDVVVEVAGAGIDTVFSKLPSFALTANVENGRINTAANANLSGNALANALVGGTGNNLLSGDAGADTLTGGGGADRFDFNRLAESGITATTRDSILDFSHADADRIDLSDLDANTAVAGNQAFIMLASSDSAFSPTRTFLAAGQLYYDQKADVLYGNVDADAAPEFSIKVIGVTALVLGDFIL